MVIAFIFQLLVSLLIFLLVIVSGAYFLFLKPPSASDLEVEARKKRNRKDKQQQKDQLHHTLLTKSRLSPAGREIGEANGGDLTSTNGQAYSSTLALTDTSADPSLLSNNGRMIDGSRTLTKTDICCAEEEKLLGKPLLVFGEVREDDGDGNRRHPFWSLLPIVSACGKHKEGSDHIRPTDRSDTLLSKRERKSLTHRLRSKNSFLTIFSTSADRSGKIEKEKQHSQQAESLQRLGLSGLGVEDRKEQQPSSGGVLSQRNKDSARTATKAAHAGITNPEAAATAAAGPSVLGSSVPSGSFNSTFYCKVSETGEWLNALIYFAASSVLAASARSTEARFAHRLECMERDQLYLQHQREVKQREIREWEIEMSKYTAKVAELQKTRQDEENKRNEELKRILLHHHQQQQQRVHDEVRQLSSPLHNRTPSLIANSIVHAEVNAKGTIRSPHLTASPRQDGPLSPIQRKSTPPRVYSTPRGGGRGGGASPSSSGKTSPFEMMAVASSSFRQRHLLQQQQQQQGLMISNNSNNQIILNRDAAPRLSINNSNTNTNSGGGGSSSSAVGDLMMMVNISPPPPPLTLPDSNASVRTVVAATVPPQQQQQSANGNFHDSYHHHRGGGVGVGVPNSSEIAPATTTTARGSSSPSLLPTLPTTTTPPYNNTGTYVSDEVRSPLSHPQMSLMHSHTPLSQPLLQASPPPQLPPPLPPLVLPPPPPPKPNEAEIPTPPTFAVPLQREINELLLEPLVIALRHALKKKVIAKIKAGGLLRRGGEPGPIEVAAEENKDEHKKSGNSMSSPLVNGRDGLSSPQGPAPIEQQRQRVEPRGRSKGRGSAGVTRATEARMDITGDPFELNLTRFALGTTYRGPIEKDERDVDVDSCSSSSYSSSSFVSSSTEEESSADEQREGDPNRKWRRKRRGQKLHEGDEGTGDDRNSEQRDTLPDSRKNKKVKSDKRNNINNDHKKKAKLATKNGLGRGSGAFRGFVVKHLVSIYWPWLATKLSTRLTTIDKTNDSNINEKSGGYDRTTSQRQKGEAATVEKEEDVNHKEEIIIGSASRGGHACVSNKEEGSNLSQTALVSPHHHTNASRSIPTNKGEEESTKKALDVKLALSDPSSHPLHPAVRADPKLTPPLLTKFAGLCVPFIGRAVDQYHQYTDDAKKREQDVESMKKRKSGKKSSGGSYRSQIISRYALSVASPSLEPEVDAFASGPSSKSTKDSSTYPRENEGGVMSESEARLKSKSECKGKEEQGTEGVSLGTQILLSSSSFSSPSCLTARSLIGGGGDLIATYTRHLRGLSSRTPASNKCTKKPVDELESSFFPPSLGEQPSGTNADDTKIKKVRGLAAAAVAQKILKILYLFFAFKVLAPVVSESITISMRVAEWVLKRARCALSRHFTSAANDGAVAVGYDFGDLYRFPPLSVSHHDAIRMMAMDANGDEKKKKHPSAVSARGEWSNNYISKSLVDHSKPLYFTIPLRFVDGSFELSLEASALPLLFFLNKVKKDIPTSEGGKGKGKAVAAGTPAPPSLQVLADLITVDLGIDLKGLALVADVEVRIRIVRGGVRELAKQLANAPCSGYTSCPSTKLSALAPPPIGLSASAKAMLAPPPPPPPPPPPQQSLPLSSPGAISSRPPSSGTTLMSKNASLLRPVHRGGAAGAAAGLLVGSASLRGAANFIAAASSTMGMVSPPSNHQINININATSNTCKPPPLPHGQGGGARLLSPASGCCPPSQAALTATSAEAKEVPPHHAKAQEDLTKHIAKLRDAFGLRRGLFVIEITCRKKPEVCSAITATVGGHEPLKRIFTPPTDTASEGGVHAINTCSTAVVGETSAEEEEAVTDKVKTNSNVENGFCDEKSLTAGDTFTVTRTTGVGVVGRGGGQGQGQGRGAVSVGVSEIVASKTPAGKTPLLTARSLAANERMQSRAPTAAVPVSTAADRKEKAVSRLISTSRRDVGSDKKKKTDPSEPKVRLAEADDHFVNYPSYEAVKAEAEAAAARSKIVEMARLAVDKALADTIVFPNAIQICLGRRKRGGVVDGGDVEKEGERANGGGNTSRTTTEDARGNEAILATDDFRGRKSAQDPQQQLPESSSAEPVNRAAKSPLKVRTVVRQKVRLSSW